VELPLDIVLLHSWLDQKSR